MSDTLESLQRKKTGAQELGAVVRTMKAMAASNIGQYETAVSALSDYYRTVALGIITYFRQEKSSPTMAISNTHEEEKVIALVFGSDQGLVGQFNDSLSDFAKPVLDKLPGKKEVWAVGERVYTRLQDSGLNTTKLYNVPGSVNAITPLVAQILIDIETQREEGKVTAFYFFHNRPRQGTGYTPDAQRLLPLAEKWQQGTEALTWPTKNLPQVIGGLKPTLRALIREYLFVSLFRACAESLASENASRLEAMQRAEKNIDELLEDLKQSYNRLRQSSIDEELFDVISGFEALK